jgi:hypothetical protein
MGFLQIITFHTDRFEDFRAVEEAWQRDSVGRRTLTGGQVFADRNTPGRYVALDWFGSYESAMVNSNLPETSAQAEQAMALATGPVEFIDLEPVGPVFIACLDGLRSSLETSTAAAHTFADDVDLDMLVPHGRVRSTGIAALEEIMRGETPVRDIEHWEVRPTGDGFVVEYAYRTRDAAEPSLAAGILLATVVDGRIGRLSLTCAGNWSAETEAGVLAEAGAFGPRVSASVS